ncbi:phosphatase PAP2 family protein [Candidatus Kaiserbacteria bacterium]|nr:phosphatase PAP2 family protein [Candidatus Kaiserbacteria bacterium]
MTELDVNILQALFAVRDTGLVQFFAFMTLFGSTFVVGGIALAAGILLLGRSRLANFAGLCTSVIGTIVVVFPLKDLIARARPDILYQALSEDTFAFPSGHASFSIALYGFLAYLTWKHVSNPTWRYAAIFAAAALILLIGFSRLYLGLHYLSDVVGGYLIGGAFLALGIWVSERLTRHPIWS